jgi:transcription termination factor Rho
MAYNIIELNEKLTTELRVLAKQMGIKRPDAYKKEELIYKILDEQAIAETKKLAENSSRQGGNAKGRTDNQKNTKGRETSPKANGHKLLLLQATKVALQKKNNPRQKRIRIKRKSRLKK